MCCDRCIRAALALTQNGVCWEINRQLTRCSGSVGANIEEAQGTTTNKDFTYGMSVALREARETRYWLRRIQTHELVAPARLPDLIQEAEEMVAIVRNARTNR